MNAIDDNVSRFDDVNLNPFAIGGLDLGNAMELKGKISTCTWIINPKEIRKRFREVIDD